MTDINKLAHDASNKRKCLNCPINRYDITKCTPLVAKACEWNYQRAFKKGYNNGAKRDSNTIQ